MTTKSGADQASSTPHVGAIEQHGNQEGEIIEVRGMRFRRVPKSCDNCGGGGSVYDADSADYFQCSECDGTGKKGFENIRLD